MALTHYKESENPFNRSRSSSCSSPIRNRIVYQEFYSIGTNTLVRSYSCSHVLDKDENGEPVQATHIQFSSFLTPEKKFCNLDARKVKTEPKKSESTISQSGKVMAKKKLKMIEEPKKKKKFGKKMWYFMWILLPVLGAVAFHLYTIFMDCTNQWDLKLIRAELKRNVFGQNNALEKINFYLKYFNNSDGMVTMLWTGGVGVGKTYSSSIIRANFPWNSNRLVTFSNAYNSGLDGLILSEFAACGCNLLVVDDLSPKLLPEALNMIYFIQSKIKEKEKVLVILIFLTHSEKEKVTVLNEFKMSSIDYFHVHFEDLDEKSVRKCFVKEIKRLKVMMAPQELDKLVKEKMKVVDFINGTVGCKGVTDEVSSYYRPAR